MLHQSDILILFAKPLSNRALQTAKSALMDCDRSVLLHQREGHQRSLLVKFDPRALTPSQLLNAVREAGFKATMAGG